MAERIVSPGVFTRERDLSFLPQGVSEIGAAIIGPTRKGPSFVPTIHAQMDHDIIAKASLRKNNNAQHGRLSQT